MVGGVVGGLAGVALVAALPPRILNITVPQVGHLPLIALRPFFIVSSTPLAISFLALHLTQYPSGIKSLTAPRFMRWTVHKLTWGCLATSTGKRLMLNRSKLDK